MSDRLLALDVDGVAWAIDRYILNATPEGQS